MDLFSILLGTFIWFVSWGLKCIGTGAVLWITVSNTQSVKVYSGVPLAPEATLSTCSYIYSIFLTGRSFSWSARLREQQIWVKNQRLENGQWFPAADGLLSTSWQSKPSCPCAKTDHLWYSSHPGWFSKAIKHVALSYIKTLPLPPGQATVVSCIVLKVHYTAKSDGKKWLMADVRTSFPHKMYYGETILRFGLHELCWWIWFMSKWCARSNLVFFLACLTPLGPFDYFYSA